MCAVGLMIEKERGGGWLNVSVGDGAHNLGLAAVHLRSSNLKMVNGGLHARC